MTGVASLFGSLFGRRAKREAPNIPPSKSTAPSSPLPLPPVDPGIPATSVDDLISSHHELLRRLRLAYGAEQPTFDRDIMSMVRRYAEYVHMLPATRDAHFREIGGLFRMGLEAGFFALQGTDTIIFSGRQTFSSQ